MPKLIKKQPLSLYKAIKFAKANGGVLPTGKEFGDLIDAKKRNASARLKRLIDAFPDCFIEKGNKKRVKYSNLVTEGETAALLCAIDESLSQKDYISGNDIEKLLKERGASSDNPFIKILLNAGYLKEILIKKNHYRLTEKYFDQKEYLVLLCSET